MISVRARLPSDRAAVAFAFAHLSARSRYQRFFTAKPELAPRELAHLVNVDHWHHEALIAFSPAPRAPIGIARYVRLEAFDTAEVAIEGVDRWQQQGGPPARQPRRAGDGTARGRQRGESQLLDLTAAPDGGALLAIRRLVDARRFIRAGFVAGVAVA